MKTLPERQVVIVGGGLAAGLVARQLVAQGVEVTILERGPLRNGGVEAKLPTQRDELRWGIRRELGQKAAVETVTLRHSSKKQALPLRQLLAFMPGTGVGGAASHWNGQSFRWNAHETQLRTRLEERYGKKAISAEMPVQDWGVAYDELEPHYDLFERLFGISGKAGNLRGQLQPGGNPYEAPREHDYPQGPLQITEAGALFAAAAEKKFGYKPFPSPAANSSGAYVNPDGVALGACQYCGHCERFVCEANAKSTPDLLLYPALQRHPKFELRPHAHVTEIHYDAAARVARGVRYVDLQSGEECFQPAHVVIVAAFALTNAKLLLVSRVGQAYDPATGKGVVGKNFTFQTVSGVNVFFRERWMNPFMGAGGGVTAIDDFNGDNFDHGGLGFHGGGLIACGTTSGRPIVSRPLPPGAPRWGTAWKQANAEWYAHSFGIGVQGSCYPHVENYLSLDPIYRDAYEQPLLRLTFDIRPNEARMSEYCTKRAEEIARAIGATMVGPAAPRRAPFDGTTYQTSHVAGGTIMGTSPETSVVSPRLQHWDAPNLFVVGSSVFAQNSGHNPTELVAALALRLGGDVARYLSRPGML